MALTEPEARCWFIDEPSRELIQLQRDRFIRNWRKQEPTDHYPNYDLLKPKFVDDWGEFTHFLASENLGAPEINQCEVSYINHIVIGEGLASFAEADKAISAIPSQRGPFLPQPEMTSFEIRYRMPGAGRLRVQMQPGIRQKDAREIVQLTLTARGRPQSSDLVASLDWFDMGHEWIVRGFADITTPVMHSIWRRTE